MASPYLTVVSILESDASVSAAVVEQRLVALREALLPHADPVDLVLVVNGAMPFPATEMEALLGRVPDVQVFVLADRVERDVAFVAGMEGALGDAVLAVDLMNHDAGLFADMVGAFTEGHAVVLVESSDRRCRTVYARLRTGFYHVYRWMTGLDERHILTQKLLGRQAVAYILQHGESAVLLRSLALGSGFPTRIFESAVADREVRDLCSALSKGARLLTTGTTRPVRLVSLLGLVGGAMSAFYMAYILAVLIFAPDVQAGWATSGLQMSGMFLILSLMLSLLAEYIVQIHSHAIRRPSYYIAGEYRSPRLSREQKLNVMHGASTDVSKAAE